MSSSESEDEIRLRSAIDHDFVNKILMQAGHSSEKSLPSLRTKEENNDTYELKVTPGFQKHVAKHLDTIIQKNIKEVNREFSGSSAAKKEKVGGIRLFSHSKSLLTQEDLDVGFQESVHPSKKRRKCEARNESSDEEHSEEFMRLSSAAVSPEWVLQKKGAYGSDEKGKVIRLKDRGDGHLIAITPSAHV